MSDARKELHSVHPCPYCGSADEHLVWCRTWALKDDEVTEGGSIAGAVLGSVAAQLRKSGPHNSEEGSKE